MSDLASLSSPSSRPTISYVTPLGRAFTGDARQVSETLPPLGVDLILTSPPFPLLKKKAYGNETESKYIDWFLDFIPEFIRILKYDGSLVLDFGGSYLPGVPSRSIYQFELLVKLVKEYNLNLAQEFFHYNPARLPSPTEWVNVRRIRVKDAVNMVWWLSKSHHPKASNRKVLKPYGASMEALLRNGLSKRKRPSGHTVTSKFQTDNGGAIPPNLLEIANTESNGAYQKLCKINGLAPHPARFPTAFADFFIRFLTEPGDVVFDPFSGSNTTGFVAEELGRRWISSELDPGYVAGGSLRFSSPTLDPTLRSMLETGASFKTASSSEEIDLSNKAPLPLETVGTPRAETNIEFASSLESTSEGVDPITLEHST